MLQGPILSPILPVRLFEPLERQDEELGVVLVGEGWGRSDETPANAPLLLLRLPQQ